MSADFALEAVGSDKAADLKSAARLRFMPEPSGTDARWQGDVGWRQAAGSGSRLLKRERGIAP